jgi:DNA-binding NtrC family response regulator
MGLFETAIGGTIFIDEIGKASVEFRNKMLQVVEYKKITRLGSQTSLPVDVRLIFAANEEKLIKDTEFINRLGLELRIPPLRERIHDLPLLISYFVAEFCKINSELFTGDEIYIDPITLGKLMAYDWPGNVRELKELCEQALFTMKETEKIISTKHISRIPNFEQIISNSNFGNVPIQISPWPGDIDKDVNFKNQISCDNFFCELLEIGEEKVRDQLINMRHDEILYFKENLRKENQEKLKDFIKAADLWREAIKNTYCPTCAVSLSTDINSCLESTKERRNCDNKSAIPYSSFSEYWKTPESWLSAKKRRKVNKQDSKFCS